MKIYGFTVIDSDPCGIDGCSAKESNTYLFKTASERDEKAWELFRDEYTYDIDNDRIDTSICDAKLPTPEEFFLMLSNSGYDYYVRPDSSYQIETFETEL